MSFKEETMGYFAYQNNTQMYNILKTPNYLAKPENKQTIKKILYPRGSPDVSTLVA